MRMTTIIDPEISEAMFEIFNGDDTAYANTVEGAYKAYWTLHKERGIQGTKVQIKNLKTNKIVWYD